MVLNALAVAQSVIFLSLSFSWDDDFYGYCLTHFTSLFPSPDTTKYSCTFKSSIVIVVHALFSPNQSRMTMNELSYMPEEEEVVEEHHTY